MTRLAVLTISIGERPWAPYSAKTMEAYADHCGADFFVETTAPRPTELDLHDLPDNPGRPNKIAYASKSYFPWKYMAKYGYDRVLVMDDTCCVRPGAGSLFEIVPPGACGIAQTNSVHAERSFEFIEKTVEAKGIKPVLFDASRYMNSGVVLYDKICLEAISPEKIAYASDLLFAGFPHQTLAYYLFALHHIPLFVYPKTYNRFPAMKLSREERFELKDITQHILDKDAMIYHVSGGYKYRDELIRQICEIFMGPLATEARPAHA